MKKKCNDGDWTVIKRIGRPKLLDSGMLRKVKDIALGTRMAKFTENHWLNTEKFAEFFKEIIFPYLEHTK